MFSIKLKTLRLFRSATNPAKNSDLRSPALQTAGYGLYGLLCAVAIVISMQDPLAMILRRDRKFAPAFTVLQTSIRISVSVQTTKSLSYGKVFATVISIFYSPGLKTAQARSRRLF